MSSIGWILFGLLLQINFNILGGQSQETSQCQWAEVEESQILLIISIFIWIICVLLLKINILGGGTIPRNVSPQFRWAVGGKGKMFSRQKFLLGQSQETSLPSVGGQKGQNNGLLSNLGSASSIRENHCAPLKNKQTNKHKNLKL